jgi:hypothetical protein
MTRILRREAGKLNRKGLNGCVLSEGTEWYKKTTGLITCTCETRSDTSSKLGTGLIPKQLRFLQHRLFCSRGEYKRSRSVVSKRQGYQRVGGVADREVYTVRSINIISQRWYFVARCIISSVGKVFGLHIVC